MLEEKLDPMYFIIPLSKVNNALKRSMKGSFDKDVEETKSYISGA